MKSEILQPYKLNVIKSLIVALDDPKRTVRREVSFSGLICEEMLTMIGCRLQSQVVYR